MPIPVDEWIILKVNDDYCILKQEIVGHFLVSAVWIGYVCSWDLPHLIFETAVLDLKGLIGMGIVKKSKRSSSPEEALEIFEEYLNEYKNMNPEEKLDKSRGNEGEDL